MEYSKNPAAVRARLKSWAARGGVRTFVPTGGTSRGLFGDEPDGVVVQQRPMDKPRANRLTKVDPTPDLFY